jgi:hypothetical protein
VWLAHRAPSVAEVSLLITHAQDQQLLGLTGSTGWFDLAVPAATIVPTIFMVFRGPEADLNSCETRPRYPTNTLFALLDPTASERKPRSSIG